MLDRDGQLVWLRIKRDGRATGAAERAGALIRMAPQAILGVLVLAELAGGDAGACARAAERYRATKAEAIDAVRVYERCIVGSLGRADCSEEFPDLDLAQAQHERAVAEYQDACR